MDAFATFFSRHSAASRTARLTVWHGARLWLAGIVAAGVCTTGGFAQDGGPAPQTITEPSAAAAPASPTAEPAPTPQPATPQPTAAADAPPAEPPAAETAPVETPPAGENGDSPLPTVAEVQQQIEAVTADATLAEEERAALLATLEATLKALKETARQASQRQGTTESIAQTPVKTQQVKKDLERLAAQPKGSEIPPELSLEDLRAAKAQADAALAAARQKEASLLATETERNSLKGRFPKLLADLQAKIQELEAQTPAADAETSAALKAARATLRAAQIAAAKESIESLMQQERVAEAEVELLPAQIKLAKQEISRQQAVVQEYAEAINTRQTVRLESMLEDYWKELAAAGLDPSRSIIDRYDKEWVQIVGDHVRLLREGAEIEAQRERIEQAKAASETEIERATDRSLGVGSGLGLRLLRERSKLPESRVLETEVSGIDKQIEWARTLQTDVESEIDVLQGEGIGIRGSLADRQSDVGSFVETAEAGKPGAWTQQQFLDREIEMLLRLNQDLDTYISDLLALRQKHELLYRSVVEYRQLIDRHVMWIRSDRGYSKADILLAWSSFQWMVHPKNLTQLGEAVWSELFRRPDGLVLWLLVILGWGFGGSHLRRYLRVYRNQAVRGNQVSMRPTLQALAATFALAALPTLFFAIPGWRIYRIPLASDYVQAVGLGLLASAALLFPLEFIRQIIRPDGLSLAHFGRKEAMLLPLRATIRCTIELLILFTFFWMLAAESGKVAIASSLGRPLFVALMATVSFGFWRVFHPRTGMVADALRSQDGGWMERLQYVWHPAISGIPLALGVLSLIGYRYSAELLTILLYKTLWLAIGLFLLRGLLRRWVMLSRRRLLLQQIRERAEAAERQAESDNDEILAIDTESPTIDISDVNAQTLRLIQALLWTLAIVGLVWTWAGVLPALDYLESWALWEVEDPNGEVRTVLTMANLLLPIPIIVLTVIAWRNVPGLLETALLTRLPLDNATRYAITTLSSYALLFIGIVLSAAEFGLRWDSIQWLVAALGVGLGFGLQEIFANFISGIILLFEQPLRVGDVVTLGDTTGVVSRIRIRATTITNYDRQELIIPNKDLITGRLVNWTLSDSTNRIVLNVGVAYGSDTRKACALLESICSEHENVSEDPSPIITFEGFGDSTLNIVVRCFLNVMSVRLVTIHELHTAINDRFREEGIEIAFPQRDLNIKVLPPELTARLAAGSREAVS